MDEDRVIDELLRKPRTFAVVGASANPDRPSYSVMRDMLEKGFRIIPVNPGLAGQVILGQTVVGSLSEIDQHVDVVDIFRAPDAALAAVDDAIAVKDKLGIEGVWMQIGVINEAAAERARAAGLMVVMDRCPKIELARRASLPL